MPSRVGGSTKWRSNGDGSYSSKSSSIANSKHLSSSSDSSISEHCGLSVSLKKFFKHNQLKDVKVRKEMMDRIDCSSAELDRRDDQVYWSTISVVNSVRHLLKGVQQLDSEHYIDLVKVTALLWSVKDLQPFVYRMSAWSYGICWQMSTNCWLVFRITLTGTSGWHRKSSAPTWTNWLSQWRRPSCIVIHPCKVRHFRDHFLNYQLD